jgi:hypothetical protein
MKRRHITACLGGAPDKAALHAVPALAAPRPVLSSRSDGEALEPTVRSAFETQFGHDFGAVRVHHDLAAEQQAAAHHAAAYTLGSDIVFGTRRYQPHNAEGRLLLGHELAHVVQQSQRGIANDAEARADAAAGQVAQGRRVSPRSLGGDADGIAGQARRRTGGPPASYLSLNQTL